MSIEVEVVAKETIKPSSPTPQHLGIFPISGLDQSAPSVYSPFFLFFSANQDDKHQRVDHLKQSLAKTLTHIYPLCGRISDNKHVICKDEGVDFFESIVSGDKLSQFLVNPQLEELEKLLPRDQEHGLLAVQVNLFECGGMVVGVLISHKISDAFSDCLFLNLWGSVARGDENAIHPPKLGMTSIFPPNNVQTSLSPTAGSPLVGKIVSKRLVFSAANIAALKANMLKTPTSRSTAVCALIWKCAMNAGRPESASIAFLAVNLRRKQIPHLSENSFGNCIATTTTSTTSHHPELPDLVDKLREAVDLVDSNYAKQLEGGDFLQLFNKVNERCSKGELEPYFFSSLCNLPFYETDFGWGKPIWVTTTGAARFKNAVILMDTKCGTGVEAWVYLDETQMDRFEVITPMLPSLQSNM